MTTADGARRVWERRLEPAGERDWTIPLRFRVVPGVWPDIQIAEPDGTRADIEAASYELSIRCDPGADGTLVVELPGCEILLAGRTVSTADEVWEVPGTGPIELAIVVEAGGGTLTVDDGGPVLLPARVSAERHAVSPVTANVAGFELGQRPPMNGRVVTAGGTVVLDAMVYGLRPTETSLYRLAAAAAREPGNVFYSSPGFVVSDARVADAAGTPAWVPDRCTIVSPIRVVEEFAWRDNPYGDMTRVVDRSEMWRSAVEPGRFLELRSGVRSIDAAFALALETFQRNSSGEFSLPGETGLWSAGYFQGSGLGFGSWRRDTSHIALRTGNLIDREVARASLAHIVNSGFDNGSDGESLPAVAVWDYVLATGDDSLIHETWPRLAAAASALDARFDDERGLVRAAQSTSNDLFDEPEAGGFALSTEVYSMETYAALAQMAAHASIDDPRSTGWAERAEAMRRAILAQYWNADRGYFTSGPVGSESHENGFWETSGAEAAVWGFLGAEVEPLTASVLAGLRDVAMCDFGVVLFPYREDDNHFCHSVWYCWQAGIARAAARTGDVALVRQLIAQQTRTAVLNKTFYEVTDARTGDSWRWPGQLWHAAGFVSLLLYGLFGIRYDSSGMAFSPAVAPEFDGARIDGLRYRAAVLDLEIRGHGSRCELLLDGRPVDRVSADCVGRHALTLLMAT